jgi:hypothetical protein
MILLTNYAEKVIAMLEKNYGGFDKIIEQLMEEVREENLAVTVENVGKKSRFTSSIVIREFLKKLPEYLRL